MDTSARVRRSRRRSSAASSASAAAAAAAADHTRTTPAQSSARRGSGNSSRHAGRDHAAGRSSAEHSAARHGNGAATAHTATGSHGGRVPQTPVLAASRSTDSARSQGRGRSRSHSHSLHRGGDATPATHAAAAAGRRGADQPSSQGSHSHGGESGTAGAASESAAREGAGARSASRRRRQVADPPAPVTGKPQRLVDCFLVVKNGKIAEQVTAAGAAVEPGTELLVDPSRAWNRYRGSGCPDFYCVVLTGATGDRRYGACLYFSNPVAAGASTSTGAAAATTDGHNGEAPNDPTTDEGADDAAGSEEAASDADERALSGTADVVLVILSHWPFYSLFKDFLGELYNVYVLRRADDHGMPVERFLCAFVSEAPLPHPNCSVEYPLLETPLFAYRPPVDALPYADPLVFATLFSCLDFHNVVEVVSFMLMEQRIMLQSVDRHRLTASAEALQALLFPFSWQHVYIPLLPAKFLPYAQAPVPLMVGVEACFAQHSDIRVAAAAAVVVDLDANQIYRPQDAVYVGNQVMQPDDPALSFPPDLVTALRRDLRSRLKAIRQGLPTPSSSTLALPQRMPVAQVPMDPLAHCQASLDQAHGLSTRANGARTRHRRGAGADGTAAATPAGRDRANSSDGATGGGGSSVAGPPPSPPPSLLGEYCDRWRWVAAVRAAFLTLFCRMFQRWDVDLEPRIDKESFVAAAPAAHHRFLSAFFETQVCSQLREAVQSKHDAGSQDAAVRAFGAALREWRHCAGFTDGEGDTDEGAAADASSVRSDPTHQHPPAMGAGSGSDAAAARRRTAAERRGATSAAGSVSGVHAAIVGRPERSLRFRALLPAAFGAMTSSVAASQSQGSQAQGSGGGAAGATGVTDFPALDKRLFPAPEPLHVAASKASASPASWSAMVDRYANSGRITSSLLAQRGSGKAVQRAVSDTQTHARPRRSTESAINIAPLAHRTTSGTGSGSSSGPLAGAGDATMASSTAGGGGTASDAHSVTSTDAPATTPLARTRRHSFGGGGVDRALIESARRRAAVQAAAVVDARNEIAVLQGQLNNAEKTRALLIAQVNAAEASRAAGEDALRSKEAEVCELRDKLLPSAQAQTAEFARRGNDLENRLQVAVQDIRHLRRQLSEAEEQLQRSQAFSVALMGELNHRRKHAGSGASSVSSSNGPGTASLASLGATGPTGDAAANLKCIAAEDAEGTAQCPTCAAVVLTDNPTSATQAPPAKARPARTTRRKAKGKGGSGSSRGAKRAVVVVGSHKHGGVAGAEAAYRVQLLQSRLQHEERQRRRLFASLQDLKRDVRRLKFPKRGRSGVRMPGVEARALTEEVAALSTQLRRASARASSRDAHLMEWTEAAEAWAVSPRDRQVRAGAGAATTRPDATVLSSAVSALLVEAATQAESLGVFLRRLEEVEQRMLALAGRRTTATGTGTGNTAPLPLSPHRYTTASATQAGRYASQQQQQLGGMRQPPHAGALAQHSHLSASLGSLVSLGQASEDSATALVRARATSAPRMRRDVGGGERETGDAATAPSSPPANAAGQAQTAAPQRL